TAGWMAHNVVHMARILKEHPIPPEGNTVPMHVMDGDMENMAPGQEKRMLPAMMEAGNGATQRRWWQLNKSGR
ncbi:MAG: hypothetical protein QOG63_2377, partial [Thermoleophilaceae bacterium]|nr:hypothetical protein [Thermoleophilaceae bacterium]